MQWFHGTPYHFKSWGNPVGVTPLANQWNSKIPHSFISLSADYNYALQYAGNGGYLCNAQLGSTAKVLDLRARSYQSILLWKKLRQTFIGRYNQRINTLPNWFGACHSGDIIDYVCNANIESAIRNLIYRGNNPSILPPSQAAWSLEDMRRAVIENTMRAAWSLGFDAVICREKITENVITQLYVTSVAHLTPPNWIEIAPKG